MPVYQYNVKSGRKWMFKVSIDGSQYMRRGYNCRADAVKAEAVFISMYDSKVRVPTFDVLLDAYLEYISQTMKPTSLYNISHTLGKHIRGHIPDKRVDQLKYSHFMAWRKYVAVSPYKKKNDLLSILRQVFVFCRDFYGYDCSAVRLLPAFVDHSPQSGKFKDEKFICYDDFKKFISVVDEEMIKLLFILTYFTGLRLGEVLGLQKEAFHSDTSELRVYQSLTNKVGKGKSVLQAPKSDSSIRKYYLPKFLSTMLTRYIADNKKKLHEFLFPISRTQLYRVIHSTCDRAGIKRFHFHQLRSTDSTLLHQLGVPTDDIAKYLGHTSSKVTTDFYLELSEKKKKEISALLEDKFSKDF